MSASPPLGEITDFLEVLKIPQHASVMLALGYDDVDEFEAFEDDALERMRTAPLEKDVPPGHVDKIVRAVRGRQKVPEAVSPAAALVALLGGRE